MAKKQAIDLNNLKQEIENRKQEKTQVVESDGQPKDQFLADLLNSLNTGKPSPSTNLIKIVENKAAERQGEEPHHNVNETEVPVRPRQTTPTATPTTSAPTMMPERDDKFNKAISTMGKQTLAESMEKYTNTSSQAHSTQQVKPNATSNTMINEGQLLENIQATVNNYLVENFAPIIEESIKSTILELYAVERIKDVMEENKEIIKKVVLETIREIQNKSKKKEQ